MFGLDGFLFGILLWGAVVLFFALVSFFGYRFLKNVSRFESRSNALFWGFLSAFVAAASLLFAPLLIFGEAGNFSKLAEEIPNRVIENAQGQLDAKRSDFVGGVMDSLLENRGIPKTPEILDAKEKAVSFASKIKGKTLSESVDSALKLFKVKREVFDDVQQKSKNVLEDVLPNVKNEEIVRTAENLFEPIAQSARTQTVKNPIFSKIFRPLSESADFSSVVGGNVAGLGAAAIGTAVGEFVKKIVSIVIFISALCALLVYVLVFWAMVLLREEKKDDEKKERARLFEFRRDIFDSINKLK